MKSIENRNKFIHDLETILEHIELVEQFLIMKINQRDYSILEDKPNNMLNFNLEVINQKINDYTGENKEK